MRVVSLVPSVTESLREWGVDPVACTRFCEQPDLACVGGTKDPDIDAIVALAPDLVVVDREENRRPDADALTGAGLAVLDLHVVSVSTALVETARLATAVGCRWSWPDLDLPRRRVPMRRAFVPIWRRPWMTLGTGTYGADVLVRLGFEVAAAAPGAVYPQLSDDDIEAARPHLVLAPSEPYPFGNRHVDELARFGPVTLVDGKDLFWWGVRTVPALRRLGDLLGSAPSRPEC